MFEHPDPWQELEGGLRGRFSARSRGLLAAEFVLSRPLDGGEFGRLAIHGAEGAELRAGSLRAVVERTDARSYRLVVGGEELLSAQTAPGELRVASGGRLYETDVSLLRNTAAALAQDGREAARVSGGLSNRSYRVIFDGEGSLAVALFLLFYVVSLRRRAYITGVSARGR